MGNHNKFIYDWIIWNWWHPTILTCKNGIFIWFYLLFILAPLSKLDYTLTLKTPTVHPKSFTELNSFLNVNITLISLTNQRSMPSASTEFAQSLKIFLTYSLLVNNCKYKINLLYKNHFLLIHRQTWFQEIKIIIHIQQI